MTMQAAPGTAETVSSKLTADPDLAGFSMRRLKAEIRARKLAAADRRDARANPANLNGHYKETPDVLDAVRRQIRSAGRRVGAMDVEELANLAQLHDDVEAAVGAAARALVAPNPAWSQGPGPVPPAQYRYSPTGDPMVSEVRAQPEEGAGWVVIGRVRRDFVKWYGLGSWDGAQETGEHPDQDSARDEVWEQYRRRAGARVPFSWTDVGRVLGVDRRSAWDKYHDPEGARRRR